MITPDQARELLDAGAYTVDEQTGCWIAADELRAPNGMGPFLASYIGRFGDPPPGFDVFHTCPGDGRSGCIRPGHLDLAPTGSLVRSLPDPALAFELRAAFSRRIRDEREARRMTRREFARELHVSPLTLKAWEEARRTPSGERYRQIAAHLGWDGRSRKWIVTVIQQIVVDGRSSGEAMRAVWDELEVDGRPLKAAVYNVRPATPK